MISVVLMPIGFILILYLFSLFTFKSKPKASFRASLLATTILFFSSIPAVSDFLMYSIENDHEAYTLSAEPVDFIVVLGCSHTTDDAWPTTSQLKACSLQRTVEALRISNLHPDAKIITSGFAGHDETPNAVKVKQALVSLGVAENKILTENFPKDTAEEAQLIAPRVLGKNVVLITNASHMPRAAKYFENEGIAVIPAPASPWVKDYYGEKGWGYYVPKSEAFNQTTWAWYETLGRAVQWLKSLF